MSAPNTLLFSLGVTLLLFAACGTGYQLGRREAPRTITDRQACVRWAGRCEAEGVAVFTPGEHFDRHVECLKIDSSTVIEVE